MVEREWVPDRRLVGAPAAEPVGEAVAEACVEELGESVREQQRRQAGVWLQRSSQGASSGARDGGQQSGFWQRLTHLVDQRLDAGAAARISVVLPQHPVLVPAQAQQVREAHHGLNLLADHGPKVGQPVGRFDQRRNAAEIGRASCRERVGPYVEISVVAGSLTKKERTSK